MAVVIVGLIFVLANVISKAKKQRSMTYEDGAHSKTGAPASIADSGNSSYSNGSSK